ncbi:MAG: SDR family NAD(P)-dependent oxidoreductase [Chloroflexota bacterium]
MKLQDKVAFITGAGSGIGKATAQRLANEGAKIAALGHNEAEIVQTSQEIERNGGSAFPLVADISDADQVQRATKQTVDRWGRIDVVFANAGINGKWAPIEELEPEDWDKTLDTNLKGTFLTIKYAVPYLKVNGGSVIVTASVNGTRIFSNTGATAYSCSKAGQVAMTKMLALELAKHRIRVNVICPGAIETNIDQNTQKSPTLDKAREPAEYPEGDIPLTDGIPGRSEQVANLVLFLASDESDHITGTEIWIDGAGSLLRG